MGRCIRCMLLTPMVILGMACLLYVPVYRGYEGELKLHTALASLKLTQSLAYAVEWTGAATFFNVTRGQMDLISSLQSNFITDTVQATDMVFDGIPVRLYRPVNASGVLPGVVYFHGGGWTVGTLDFFDIILRPMTARVGAVFVSVEYRLAPEHKFPVPFEDSLTAALHFVKNANKFGVDPKRVALAGDSAGGNLAATVSLKLSTMKDIMQPCFQMLIYPALQPFDMQTPSYQQYSNDRFLSKRIMVDFWANYAQGYLDDSLLYDNNSHVDPATFSAMSQHLLDHSTLPKELLYEPYEKMSAPKEGSILWKELQQTFLNPFFSPVTAEDLSGVPTAYLITCQHDVLRDDGFFYAKHLELSGVKVVHHHLEHGFHGFLYLQEVNIPHVEKMVTKLFGTMSSMLRQCGT